MPSRPEVRSKLYREKYPLTRKTCPSCGEVFTPEKRRDQIYCSVKCYRQGSYYRSYSKEYMKKNRPRYMKNRKLLRRKIQELWGKVEASQRREVWKKSEALAPSILKKEGFTNILLLSELNAYFPFDVKAERNHKIHVFQVTVRTHTDSKKRLLIARHLRLEPWVLWIKPDLTGYLLKHVANTFNLELNLKDLEEVKPCISPL